MIFLQLKQTMCQSKICFNKVLYPLLVVLAFTVSSGCSHHMNSANKPSFNQSEFEHNMQGEQYLHSGQYSAALREFQTASEISPDDWPSHNQAGIILEQQGRLREAIVEYQTVIRIDYKEPHNPADKSRWHFRLAGALLKANRTKEARKEYIKASHIASQDKRRDKKLAALAKQSLQLARTLP